MNNIRSLLTVILSQLIQRGIIMVAMVMAAAIGVTKVSEYAAKRYNSFSNSYLIETYQRRSPPGQLRILLFES